MSSTSFARSGLIAGLPRTGFFVGGAFLGFFDCGMITSPISVILATNCLKLKPPARRPHAARSTSSGSDPPRLGTAFVSAQAVLRGLGKAGESREKQGDQQSEDPIRVRGREGYAPCRPRGRTHPEAQAGRLPRSREEEEEDEDEEEEEMRSMIIGCRRSCGP